ncbi:MAG: exodeoxyribonuclease VII large subunit [Clostridia bacterium]|nr:exodeoxyribonuclease VII large subunit [Clostridia bacterium]
MEGHILNVTALNGYINSIFRAEEMLHGISVAGEVSGIKVSKGHAYFTLKDEKSQISCNSFNYVKTYLPKDGESVIVKGSVDYYAAGGRLNFIADTITPLGKGYLAYKLELLRAKLEAEGLFDEIYKKQIPAFPTNVCVITSINGAVIRDINKTVRRKNQLIDIYIKDVKVQGKDAHIEIADALQLVDKLNFDVIIIARGGGSAEDLMPFNEELLAREIFKCKTPVISAVGHETDFTICDRVADYRAATPTAAAEKIAYDVESVRRYLAESAQKIKIALANSTALREKDLKVKINSLKTQMQLCVSDNTNRLNSYIGDVKKLTDKLYSSADANFNYFLTKLTALNPLGVLQKGYWYVSKDGKALLSAKDMHRDDIISMKTHDGEVKALITEVKI